MPKSTTRQTHDNADPNHSLDFSITALPIKTEVSKRSPQNVSRYSSIKIYMRQTNQHDHQKTPSTAKASPSTRLTMVLTDPRIGTTLLLPTQLGPSASTAVPSDGTVNKRNLLCDQPRPQNTPQNTTYTSTSINKNLVLLENQNLFDSCARNLSIKIPTLWITKPSLLPGGYLAAYVTASFTVTQPLCAKHTLRLYVRPRPSPTFCSRSTTSTNTNTNHPTTPTKTPPPQHHPSTARMPFSPHLKIIVIASNNSKPSKIQRSKTSTAPHATATSRSVSPGARPTATNPPPRGHRKRAA